MTGGGGRAKENNGVTLTWNDSGEGGAETDSGAPSQCNGQQRAPRHRVILNAGVAG